MKLIPVLLLGLLIACNPDRIYEDYHKVEDYSWASGDEKTFEAEILREGNYDILLNIRNTGDYRWQNIWVSIQIEDPSGEIKYFKSDLRLANKDGSWRGQGLGDIIDHRFLVLDNFKVSTPGTYTIKVSQLMREEVLDGIMEVGIAVMKEE